jgi:hypothetical protein
LAAVFFVFVGFAVAMVSLWSMGFLETTEKAEEGVAMLVGTLRVSLLKLAV